MSAGRAEIALPARPGRSAAGAVRMAALAALAALALGLAGCGDEDEGPAGPQPGGGRTINFPGDAATLQAALDMAASGDTVRVGAGTHAIDASLVIGAGRAGVALIGRLESELPKSAVASGAERPVLDIQGPTPKFGILVQDAAADVTIRGLQIRGAVTTGVSLSAPGGRLVDCRIDSASTYAVSCPRPESTIVIEENLLLEAGLFGVRCAGGARPVVRGNTIVGAGDCGIYSEFSAPVCERNVVVESANWGIACFGPPVPALSCNALFDNVTADYSPECTPGAGDFHADPLFCDATSYAIRSDSPCAAANAGACGLIGAVDVGCTPP